VNAIRLLAPVVVFSVMLALGLLLGREQVQAALRRRVVLAAVIFGVVVPLPALAVAVVKLAGLKGAVAAGVILMAISPGAPIALRRAIEAGGDTRFAPALHLAVVLTAVVTVPACVWIMDWIFRANVVVTPLDVARQVFFAQILPLGLGAGLRAWRPALAARIEPPLARASGALLLALVAACAWVLGPGLVAIGWAPTLCGVGLTLLALAIGAAFAGRDSPVRPAGAVAAAMRNPGLALLIATRNRMPEAVTVAVFGYALGLAAVVAAFLFVRRRRDAGQAGGRSGPRARRGGPV
jgi:BASS family bile acid:Na+ symporter